MRSDEPLYRSHGWLILLVLLLLAPACTNARHDRWGIAHELRIAMLDDPTSLNPLFGYIQRQIDLGQLYAEPLVGLGQNGDAIPLLAVRVPSKRNGDISADGMTVTYHLRRGVRFADGVAMTSRDVAFTYRAIMDPRNRVTDVVPYRRIASLTTPDASTVRIRLREPWSAAVSELFAASDVAYGILPAHAFSNNTDVSHAAWNSHPFGTGPFRVVEWRRGDSILLEANQYAWRRPHLKRLVFRIAADDATRFNMLRTHEVDVGNLSIDQVQAAQALADTVVIPVMRNRVDFLEFQTTRAPTSDRRVRQALAEAIDRDAILRQVYHGIEPSGATEISPVTWAHDSSITAVQYDPARAAADLNAAGWHLHGGTRSQNLVPLHIDVAFESPSDVSRRIATLVQADLKVVGVDAAIRGSSLTLYFAPPAAGGIVYGGNYNLAVNDLYGGPDPEQSEVWACDQRAPNGPNMSRWCNRSYDALFAAQQKTWDRTVRLHAFEGMQRTIRDDNVLIPLIYYREYIAVNPGLRGFRPNMLYDYSNADEWDLIP